MFRFADTKVNNGSCAAAANRAEATFSCAAANTNNGMNSKVMDAVYAASILICLPIFGLRVLVLSILGLILSHAALGMKSQAEVLKQFDTAKRSRQAGGIAFLYK